MADKAKPAGISQRKATEDDAAPAGLSQRKATEDDDVEGHSMLLDPGIARQIAQARERDVQQNLKRHQVERDARASRKDGR